TPSAPTDKCGVQIRRVSSSASSTRPARLSITTKSFPPPAIFENGSGSCFTAWICPEFIGIFIAGGGLNRRSVLSHASFVRVTGAAPWPSSSRRNFLEDHCPHSYRRPPRCDDTLRAADAAADRSAETERNHRRASHQRRCGGNRQEGECDHRSEEGRLRAVRKRRPENRHELLRGRGAETAERRGHRSAGRSDIRPRTAAGA